MNFLEILWAIRKTRRAFKTAKLVRSWIQFQEAEHLANITTQAAAYGFEIGRGKPLVSELQSSPDNPFLDGTWRSQVDSNG